MQQSLRTGRICLLSLGMTGAGRDFPGQDMDEENCDVKIKDNVFSLNQSRGRISSNNFFLGPEKQFLLRLMAATLFYPQRYAIYNNFFLKSRFFLVVKFLVI